jgi:hypothetical protein
MPRKAKVSRKGKSEDASTAAHAAPAEDTQLSQAVPSTIDKGQSPEQLEHETRSGLHYVDETGKPMHGTGVSGEKSGDSTAAVSDGTKVEHEMRSGLHYVDMPSEGHSHHTKLGSSGAEERIKSPPARMMSPTKIMESKPDTAASMSSGSSGSSIQRFEYIIRDAPKATDINGLMHEMASKYSVPFSNVRFAFSSDSSKDLSRDEKLEDIREDILLFVRESSDNESQYIISLKKEHAPLSGTKRKATSEAGEDAQDEGPTTSSSEVKDVSGDIPAAQPEDAAINTQ